MACDCPSLDAVKTLLRNGADAGWFHSNRLRLTSFSAKNHMGSTPLHIAVRAGAASIVDELLSVGADVAEKDYTRR